jgi:hypothetical protein
MLGCMCNGKQAGLRDSPLSNDQAAAVMSDPTGEQAIIGTPQPGNAVINFHGMNVLITKDSSGNIFFTDTDSIPASVWNALGVFPSEGTAGVLYVLTVGPALAIEQAAANWLGGEASYMMATLEQKAAAISATAEQVLINAAGLAGKMTAAAVSPIAVLIAGLGILYLVGHKQGAFPSLRF